jgi:hypothetical protein
MRRSLTLVGLASGTLQRAELLDADDRIVARLTAHNGRKEFLTALRDPAGQPIAAMTRVPAVPAGTMSLTDQLVWDIPDRDAIVVLAPVIAGISY